MKCTCGCYEFEERGDRLFCCRCNKKYHIVDPDLDPEILLDDDNIEEDKPDPELAENLEEE